MSERRPQWRPIVRLCKARKGCSLGLIATDHIRPADRYATRRGRAPGSARLRGDNWRNSFGTQERSSLDEPAAGLRRVGGPFPDVADHIEQSGAVGAVAADQRDADLAVIARVDDREDTLSGVGDRLRPRADPAFHRAVPPDRRAPRAPIAPRSAAHRPSSAHRLRHLRS